MAYTVHTYYSRMSLFRCLSDNTYMTVLTFAARPLRTACGARSASTLATGPTSAATPASTSTGTPGLRYVLCLICSLNVVQFIVKFLNQQPHWRPNLGSWPLLMSCYRCWREGSRIRSRVRRSTPQPNGRTYFWDTDKFVPSRIREIIRCEAH